MHVHTSYLLVQKVRSYLTGIKESEILRNKIGHYRIHKRLSQLTSQYAPTHRRKHNFCIDKYLRKYVFV
jgi:hypothetical protein